MRNYYCLSSSGKGKNNNTFTLFYFMDYTQLDAAEKYLRRNRFRNSYHLMTHVTVLGGMMIFVALYFVSFILRGTHE